MKRIFVIKKHESIKFLNKGKYGDVLVGFIKPISEDITGNIETFANQLYTKTSDSTNIYISTFSDIVEFYNETDNLIERIEANNE